MYSTESIILIGIISAVVTIAAAYIFIRWALSIKQQVSNQKSMIKLLLIIAEKHVGPTDEIATIRDEVNRSE